MELDFSGLNSIAIKGAQKDFKEPFSEDRIKLPIQEETAPEAPQRAQEEGIGERATVKLNREQEDRKRTEEVYRKYQQNIKRSEVLRAEIMKGVNNGEPPLALLLKASKCISLMTGDTLFYNHIEDKLEKNYKE